jgi:adenylosuccinate synthase
LLPGLSLRFFFARHLTIVAATQACGQPTGSGKLRLVPATVIVGAQWGDEGKGKIVDLLAQHSDLVCRYQGGPNAGHTIVAGGERFKFHHMPSGILHGKECILGAGCVIDPETFVRELDELDERGISTGCVRVSGEAHLIMPWHVAIDQGTERRLGNLQIGTTKRGIGPAYADKAARLGIRVQDLLDPKILRQKIEVALAEKNVWLERVYGSEPLELEELAGRYEGFAQRLRPYVADTSLLVDRALHDGRFVLLEGAQGTLLDLDHGTYPFVTSSGTVAGAAAVGVGIGPNRIDAIIGVAKAYVTRVGEGPFPTEIEGADQERVREIGAEFGTTTGRERRCGWLDLVALRYAVRLNGITSLALTKLDVLSSFAQLPVCVRYRLRDGTETADFPAHQSDFHHCRPVYEMSAGWEEPLDEITELGALPENARRYVEFVERELDVPVSLIGTGADRERVLAPGSLEALARP